jgi:hypothetical protein
VAAEPSEPEGPKEDCAMSALRKQVKFFAYVVDI